MPTLAQLWQHGLLWNGAADWGAALVAFLIPLIALPVVKGFIAARRRRWLESGRRLPLALELMARLALHTSKAFIWGVALYCAFEQLTFPANVHLARRIDRGVTVAIILVFWFQVARWATAALRFGIEQRRSRSNGADPALAGSMDIILFIAGVVIWGVAGLMALDSLGVAVKPLLAGLGIGGIAVALAVQTVLGDLLACISIALDRPFSIGDSLTVDNLSGTVEHIGVKSTRLRSSTGEQIVMSNTDILKSRVRNYGRMQERTITFDLPVMPGTAPALLRRLPDVIGDIVAAVPRTRFTRCRLMSCTESALRYEVVYVVLSSEYTAYAECQQEILIRVLEKFGELGIQLPAPMLALLPARAAQPA
ncbi:MAG TPA: mechanosensitive ion channel family protein [Steroidobacteraceae bacterium]|nr:mechanosensitive ion channel family protein [Steroidobacteraceae bacterium]